MLKCGWADECQKPTLNLGDIISVGQRGRGGTVDEALQRCVSIQFALRESVDFTNRRAAEQAVGYPTGNSTKRYLNRR